MGLMAEFKARAYGNELCRTLAFRGYVPLWFKAEAEGERIVLCVLVMGSADDPVWRKALVLDPEDSPDAVEATILEWKAKLLAELNEGKPCETVRGAIVRFGENAVRGTLSRGTVH